MHDHSISKQIINVTNNIRAIKALWVIICHQKQGFSYATPSSHEWMSLLQSQGPVINTESLVKIKEAESIQSKSLSKGGWANRTNICVQINSELTADA